MDRSLNPSKGKFPITFLVSDINNYHHDLDTRFENLINCMVKICFMLFSRANVQTLAEELACEDWRWRSCSEIFSARFGPILMDRSLNPSKGKFPITFLVSDINNYHHDLDTRFENLINCMIKICFMLFSRANVQTLAEELACEDWRWRSCSEIFSARFGPILMDRSLNPSKGKFPITFLVSDINNYHHDLDTRFENLINCMVKICFLLFSRANVQTLAEELAWVLHRQNHANSQLKHVWLVLIYKGTALLFLNIFCSYFIHW